MEAFIARLNTTESIKTLYRRYGLWVGWVAMLTVVLGNVATLLSGTMINVAIPDIMGTFGIGQNKAQWLATAFLASSSVTMLMNAWLISRFGIRYTVATGMSIFMVGSILGGLSPTFDLLIAARILQGAATGMITPMAMSLVFLFFPRGRQSTVMGVSSIGLVVAPALGPLVGGTLIDTLSWRYVYLMGMPVSMVVLPLSLLFLPHREPNTKRRSLDGVGVVLITATLVSLLVGLSNGQPQGWTSNYTVFWLTGAVLSGAAFIVWEQHAEYPLLDLRVFGYFRFSMMSFLAFIFGAGLYGSTYLVPLFSQIVQELSATEAGLLMLPAGLVMAVIVPVAGRLGDRLDHRIILACGFTLLAISSVLMSGGDRYTGWWTFAYWLIISRIAIAMMSPILNVGALQALPPKYLQHGAGTTNFIRQLGGAFGVNLLSVTLSLRTSFHADALVATQSYGHSQTLALMSEIQRNLASAGAGLTFWEQQQFAFNALGRAVHQQASEYGFQDGFLILGVVFFLTLVPVVMLGRPTIGAARG